MNKIQILITDNHKLSRENLSFVLNCDSRFEVMGECAIPEEAVAMARSGSPDIVLMSINEPAFSELDATEQLRDISPLCGVIGISSNPQPSFAKKIMQKGAKGYVTKNSSKDEIVRAILEVNQGNKYVCAEVKNIIADQLFSDEEDASQSGALTKREIQIINYIKNGMSSKEIASNLFISLRTVQAHRYNILKKLKLKNSASLVNFMNTRAAYM